MSFFVAFFSSPSLGVRLGDPFPATMISICWNKLPVYRKFNKQQAARAKRSTQWNVIKQQQQKRKQKDKADTLTRESKCVTLVVKFSFFPRFSSQVTPMPTDGFRR